MLLLPDTSHRASEAPDEEEISRRARSSVALLQTLAAGEGKSFDLDFGIWVEFLCHQSAIGGKA